MCVQLKQLEKKLRKAAVLVQPPVTMAKNNPTSEMMYENEEKIQKTWFTENFTKFCLLRIPAPILLINRVLGILHTSSTYTLISTEIF